MCATGCLDTDAFFSYLYNLTSLKIVVSIKRLLNHSPEIKQSRELLVHQIRIVRSVCMMEEDAEMMCYILAQTNKMNLVHRAEVQDPAGVLRHGHHSVLIRRLFRLLQVVPLSRRIMD